MVANSGGGKASKGLVTGEKGRQGAIPVLREVQGSKRGMYGK